MARGPIPSRSGLEPSGEPIFEDEAWAGETGTFCSVAPTCHEKRQETTTLGCGHFAQDKTRIARDAGKTPRTFEQEMALSQHGYGRTVFCVNRDVVCQLPPQACHPPHIAVRLKKPACGMSHAPRRWWNVLGRRTV